MWTGAQAPVLIPVPATMMRRPRTPRPRRSSLPVRLLTRPIRLEVPSAAVVGELVEALRIHHYRLRPVDEAEFRDWFFDTSDGALAANGWSYRFRQRRRGSAGVAWAVRLERPPSAAEIERRPADTCHRVRAAATSR